MITIEKMQFEDIPAVSPIFIDAFNNSPAHETWTEKTSIAHLKETYQENLSFVVKENDSIVGALIARSVTFDTGLTCYIDALIVKADKRGKGYGKLLIEKVMETAKANSMTSIQLEAHAKLPSFEWYKKQGFEESGWVDLLKTLV
jgi:predicted N-acetyltransferase YhbS